MQSQTQTIQPTGPIAELQASTDTRSSREELWPTHSQLLFSDIPSAQVLPERLTKKHWEVERDRPTKHQKTAVLASGSEPISNTQCRQQIKNGGADLLATLKTVNDNALILLQCWEWQGFHLSDLQRQFDENFASTRKRFLGQIDAIMSLFEHLGEGKKEIELLCSEPIAKFRRDCQQFHHEQWCREIWLSVHQIKGICDENLDDAAKCESSALNALGLYIEIAKGRSLRTIHATKNSDTVQYALEYGSPSFQPRVSSPDKPAKKVRFCAASTNQATRALSQNDAPGPFGSCEYSQWIAKIMRSKGLGNAKTKKNTAQSKSLEKTTAANAISQATDKLQNVGIEDRVQNLQYHLASSSGLQTAVSPDRVDPCKGGMEFERADLLEAINPNYWETIHYPLKSAEATTRGDKPTS